MSGKFWSKIHTSYSTNGTEKLVENCSEGVGGERKIFHTTIINSGDRCLLYFYILKSIPRERERERVSVFFLSVYCTGTNNCFPFSVFFP